MHIRPDPLAALEPGRPWVLAYDVVLRGFHGGWYEAAQVYREWAVGNALWTRHGDLSARLASNRFPRWLTQVPLLTP